ncbi:MAG: MaoC/PaaZ C-terminal domain-containing protein [Solirubrobacterales bacterium]
MTEWAEGDKIAEMKVTPDKYVPHRYAGATGDFNPIHIDSEFARMVGLPDSILHGLYVMGLVARAGTSQVADGDPRALRRLSVQFRGMSFPEQEITVSGEVKANDGESVTLDLVAAQGENAVIRNASAEISLPSA